MATNDSLGASTTNETPVLEETLLTLTTHAKGRFGGIDGSRIAAHVIAVTRDADWPVRKAALEALSRRYGYAARDALKVVERPRGRGVLGVYRTAKRGAKPRGEKKAPYETSLLSLSPLRTSCACADFTRSSLGLCKHGLVVIEALSSKALSSYPSGGSAHVARSRPTLVWDHVHPLRGPADRLARVRLVPADATTGKRKPRDLAALGFSRGAPVARTLDDVAARLAWIVVLERALRKGTLDAEPAISALLAEERTRAERVAGCARDARVAMKKLAGLKRKLYPYQREGVARFFARGRLLLADDMGLGKTTQAIAACHALYEVGSATRGLLIVPAALKQQWKREWDATTHVSATVVDGSPNERARLYATTKRGFLIIGYEQLLRDFEQVRTFAPQMVVLDEAQRIKNWATKSAAYVKALSPEYRLVLTGTPMENRFDELASIMDFVDDVALEPKWRLTPWHSMQSGDGGKGRGGARNLDTLRERLSGSMLRRVRTEVLSQLPARTDVRVPVELTDAQRAEHDELIQPIAAILGRASRRPLTQAEFLKLMQMLTTQRMICNGLAQLDFENVWPRCASSTAPTILASLASPKLAALRGLIEQVVVSQGRKAVVFSQWRNMLKLAEWSVRDLLAEAGVRAVFFTGAESRAQRERSILELHDDPATTVMFLSDAGGVGLNLQRAASCCINLELPWNPAVLEQRIGRIHRLGQTLPIDVYNLVTEEGIESRIASLVAQKKAVFSTLFDGVSDEVAFDGDGSFLEGVRKLVDPVDVPPASNVELGDEEPIAPQAADTEVEASAPVLPSASGAPAPSTARTAEILSGLRFERRADGGLRIDAPPELAAPLADLLESLARSLRAGA